MGVANFRGVVIFVAVDIQVSFFPSTSKNTLGTRYTLGATCRQSLDHWISML